MKQLIALIEKEMSIKNLQSKLIILNLIFITTVVYLLCLMNTWKQKMLATFLMELPGKHTNDIHLNVIESFCLTITLLSPGAEIQSPYHSIYVY